MSCYVDISKIPNAGRGLFASEDFKKDDVICYNYSWDIDYHTVLSMQETMNNIMDITFSNPDKKLHRLLIIGKLAFVNHSIDSNAVVDWKNSNIGYIGILYATKNIKKREEIFINYNRHTNGKGVVKQNLNKVLFA